MKTTKKMKRILVEYGVFAGIIMILSFTGLHTDVFGFIQQGELKTGILNPDVEKKSDQETYVLPKADFTMKLTNSQGEEISMEQFRGKVVFINIWATWCPPCIYEMPGINNLYNDLQGGNVVFLMLSVDENFEKAKRFKEKKGFDFEIYQVIGEFPPMYYSQSIPTTFVINANGELALTHEGMANYDTAEFKSFLKSLT